MRRCGRGQAAENEQAGGWYCCVMTSHRHNPHHHVEAGGADMGDLLQYRYAPLKRLWISLAITVAGMGIEIAGGVLTGSLALLSDAGHMFTHMFALGISAVAVRFAAMEPCHHRTFGLLRAEVLAAYTNALFLLAVTAYILYEAAVRFVHPVDVLTREMLIVAGIGLAVNAASILLLHGHGENIGVRSVVAHMMADAVSSVAIVAGAVVMAFTGWTWVDPLLSVGIAALIVVWAWGLLRDTVRILMEVAPAHVNTGDVERFVAQACPRVAEIDRVRIWSITENVVAFSAEIAPAGSVPLADIPDVKDELAGKLKSRFGFTETTLEVKTVPVVQ